MKLQESGENYLEAILMLSQKNEFVRSIDIANKLEFTKPSVSIAMKNLRENGYINMDLNGHITLTEAGREVAERIYERHTVITNILMALGVDRETAQADACKIEHDISQKSFECMKKHFYEKQAEKNK